MGRQTRPMALIPDRSGPIAEGFYGVPRALMRECRKRLPPGLRNALRQFDNR